MDQVISVPSLLRLWWRLRKLTVNMLSNPLVLDHGLHKFVMAMDCALLRASECIVWFGTLRANDKRKTQQKRCRRTHNVHGEQRRHRYIEQKPFQTARKPCEKRCFTTLFLEVLLSGCCHPIGVSSCCKIIEKRPWEYDINVPIDHPFPAGCSWVTRWNFSWIFSHDLSLCIWKKRHHPHFFGMG